MSGEESGEKARCSTTIPRALIAFSPLSSPGTRKAVQPFTRFDRLKSNGQRGGDTGVTFLKRGTLLLSGPSCGLPAVVRFSPSLSEP